MSALDSAALNANYAIHGVDAVLTLAAGGDPYDIRVCDDTVGLALQGFSVGVQTIEPMCSVRMADLDELELTPDMLRGCTIVFSGKSWKSRGNRLKPVPSGVDAGELLMLLAADND